MIKIFATLILFLFTISILYSQCFSCYDLRENKYNETAFLTTHNSFNCNEGGFQMPNQTNCITTQLNDGVRALMIDVYDKNGIPTVYHSLSFLGSVPLSSNLNEIKTFLEDNPTEIITIIFQSNISADMTEQAFIDAGLNDYLFEKNDLLPWPTLEEMINSNKRLVVFTDQDDASDQQKWYHYVWDYAVETHFTVNSVDEFTCDYNRGDPENDLFIFNHFITSSVGIGNIDQATTANSNPFFISRINDCIFEKEKLPNFITVDFYETGNCCDVVNTLNSMYVDYSDIINSNVQIYPQPANELIFVRANAIKGITLFEMNGKIIINLNDLNSDEIILNLQTIEKGIYLLKTISKYKSYINKLVKI